MQRDYLGDFMLIVLALVGLGTMIIGGVAFWHLILGSGCG